MKKKIVERKKYTAKTMTLKSVSLTTRVRVRLECGHVKDYAAGREPKGDLTACGKCDG